MTDKKTVWFPAKDNGWGWGKPTTWQGWIVLVAYFLAVVVVSFRFDPKIELLNWAISVVACTIFLIGMYVWKGEAPNWKWKTIEKDKRKWFK
ncbi:MAG: hypothetical protein ACTH58_06460 [Marinomonas foliarum]|jgi:RsiW-degrading membrane proteinase PrsW (M82 family)|uniref:Uncharacterized protein n=1 Tax=Marinomonas foliarum TaxID=491950 RepID=A0A369AHS9_9GAMM|nr:hypothetical protein [Marinomonas foliarum]QRV23308.1 hypothetical protein JSY38_14765 [Marinomonas foliarum]RCX08721.1 hypothetical protein DFP77_10139 [Marinomonas foliarum]